jgi:putative ABC transport system permease protein
VSDRRWRPDRYGRLRALVRGVSARDEVDEELAHHVELLAGDLVRGGMDERSARAEAARRFGDVRRIREETVKIDESIRRDAGRAEHVTSLVRELRLAGRALLRNPGFTVAAMVTLGLGIGATAAIYALLDAVVLRPLAYTESEQLVHVHSLVPGIDPDAQWGLSEAGYFRFRESSRTLSGLAMVGNAFSATSEATVTGGFGAERVRTASVSASAFEVLGIVPALGRPFHESEDARRAPHVAILGWDYWQRRYGGEPMLGRTIEISSLPHEVVGILPAGMHLPSERVDVWLPAGIDAAREPVNSHWLGVIGRLAPGATVEQAQAELDAITGQFATLFPRAYGGGFIEESGFRTGIVPLRDQVVGGMARTLWILLGAVSFVLLIAAANVANLFLVRLESRRREVALRSALGAGRRDLAWHYLGESLIVAAGGAVVALLFAHGAMRVMIALAPPGFPRLSEVGVTAGAIAVILGTALAAALVFGLAPLLQGRFRAETLREGRTATASRRRRALRGGLVVTQTALALLLLVGAGLMLQSYRHLRAVDLGFDTRDALTFSVSLPPARYDSWAAVAEFHRLLHERIAELPGVATVGATTLTPMPERTGCSVLFAEDRPASVREDREPCVATPLASPSAFAALGIPLNGETSPWSTVQAGAGGVVVTRALADRLWPGEDPIGKGLRGNGAQPPYYRVVGVTEPVRLTSVDGDPVQAAFFPFVPMEDAWLWSPPYTATFIVRTDGRPPLELVAPIRAALAALDADVPLARVETLQDRVTRSASMARTSFTLMLLLVAGGIALVLSAVGIYGVIAYVVAQRTAEIGLRVALGARTGQVRALVVRQSLTLVAAGLVIGGAAAFAGTRVLQSLLFEISATDPFVIASVALVLLGVAAVASFVPAHRAARVEPMRVLRME